MNIKIVVMLIFIAMATLFSGCLEDSRDDIKVGTEYNILSAKITDDKQQIQIVYVINNTFNKIKVAFVECDAENSRYRATGVYIQDNKSYFKLVRNEYLPREFIETSSKYHFEIHITDDDLESYLKGCYKYESQTSPI